MAINEGDVRRVSVAFSAPDPEDTETFIPTDPTTIVLYYKKPGEDFTTLTYGVDTEVEKDSTGNYYCDLTLDAAGLWRYEWEGTGAVTANEGGQFRVYARVVRG